MSWNEEARISCRFKFKCPKVWRLLQPTEREDVRHCSECDRDVHLALTEEDFRQHSAAGRCIAVPVLQPDGTADSDMPVYAVGMASPPYRPSLKLL